MEDDGRRVHQAQVHVASCTDRPDEHAEAHMALTSPDRLEMRLAGGTVWFEIQRGMARGKQTRSA